MYQRILVPLDGSDLAQTAMTRVLELCRALGATLVLLHVRDPRQGSVEAARRYLEHVQRQYGGAGVPLQMLVREGPVAETILQSADEAGCDMIAMATHGRSGLQRVVYGSVAEQVLRSSTLPVLLLRVPGAPTEAPS